MCCVCGGGGEVGATVDGRWVSCNWLTMVGGCKGAGLGAGAGSDSGTAAGQGVVKDGIALPLDGCD